METLFLVWSDYDGVRVEEFDDISLMELRVNELMVKQQVDGYGSRIDLMVKGRKLEARSQEVKTVWRVNYVKRE